MIQTSPARAPSATLPLRYLVTAAAMFLIAALAIPFLASELAGHYYHPRVLALTHAVTLGWITLTIMGASYQLIPIVLGRPIWSERLAGWQFVVFVVGVMGMVSHFFIAEWSGLVWAAGAVALGVTLHVVNAALSLRGITRYTFTAQLVILALAGLAATMLAGVVLGLDHMVKLLPIELLPALHAHVHLALLGWVAPMLVGVAARVYPMFLLAPEPGGALGPLQVWGFALGVPAITAGIALDNALVVVGALAVASALAAHALWIVRIARDRKRPALDWGLRFVLTATAFLLPATALGLALACDLISGPRPALAYAVLALGWVSLSIVGMMLKIVPFLVWYQVYSPHAGRAPVPTLSQLSWPAAERLAYALLIPGVLGLGAAVGAGDTAWIRVAGALVACGAAAFAVALASVLRQAVSASARRVLVAREARVP